MLYHREVYLVLVDDYSRVAEWFPIAANIGLILLWYLIEINGRSGIDLRSI